MKTIKLGIVLISLNVLFGCSGIDKLINGPEKDGQGNMEINFLIIGQSNGDSPANSHPRYYSANVVLDDINTNQIFTPTKENPSYYGISWIYLADIIMDKNARKSQFFLRSSGNTNSRDMIGARLSSITDVLKSQRIDYVLWIQGESDRMDGLTNNESLSAYKTIFTEVLRYIPSNRVYVALDGFPKSGPARYAQEWLIRNNWVKRGPDIDRMREFEPHLFEYSPVGVGAEFSGQGLKKHAEAWFSVLKREGGLRQ